MPEPVITLISGVAAIVTNAWRVSKDLYDIIEGIRNAPTHVRAIMVDVDGLYIILGALQGLLPSVDASRLRADLVPVFESLQLNLNNCCSILIELSRKLIRYTNAAGQISMSKWMAFRWQFTEKDVKEFRDHLTAYKMTVQLAISTANFANSTQSLDTNERIGTEIEQMRAQVNEIAFSQDLLGRSDIGDHGSVTTEDTDRGFALRRFLMTTESVFSGSPPSSPGTTGNREGSVSPPLLRFGAQPARVKRVPTGSMSIRDGGSGSSSSNPFSWETESRSVERTRLGDIRATSRGAHQNILPEEDLEVLQPTQDHQRQYRHHQISIPDLHEEKEDDLSYTSPPSLARKIAFLDSKDDDHAEYDLYQSRQPKPSIRSLKSSGGLREPRSNAKPAHTKVTLSPIQESAPASIPTYASIFNEEQVGRSQGPSPRMEEHPVWATKDKAPAPDAEEARKQTNAKALPGYHRDIQSLMDHWTVQDTQWKARDEEFLSAITAASIPVEAAKSGVRRVQELVGRDASLPRSDSDKERPRQETEEKIAKKPEALKLTHYPIADLSDASSMAPYRGGEFPDTSYDNMQQRHPFDETFGETQIVQEVSIDTGCHVMAGSEQIGKLQERIHSGDDYDAKGVEYRPHKVSKDGSPVAIATGRKKTKGDLPTRKSQTSLLIDYFDSRKGVEGKPQKPTVRVRATPSSKNRKPSSNDHIQITKRKGTRKPSYTKRTLSPGESDKVPEGDGDDKNTARSHLLEAEEPNPTSRRGSPIEVEIMPRRVENPSNKPEMAPTQLENYNQPRDSLHEQHPSNTIKIPPTLQVDSREDVQEEATGEARTKEPVITARGGLSTKSSINNPKLLEAVDEAIRRLILPELAALEHDRGRKQRREERLMDNKYDKDVPGKVRRKHRSRSITQDAEQ